MGGLYDAATLHAGCLGSWDHAYSKFKLNAYHPVIGSTARLAQSAQRKALNLVVVGLSPTVGEI